jgi:hypothetical protein
MLGGVFAGVATLDPERALWVPGKRKIFIPAPVQLAEIDVNAIIAEMVDRSAWRYYSTLMIGGGDYLPSSFSVPMRLSSPSGTIRS